MKYQVGDKVKIKSLKAGQKCLYDFIYDVGMKKYENQIATIDRIDTFANQYYNLDIDNGDWCWTEDMLEPVIPKTMKGWELLKLISESKIKNGTKFKINNYDSIYKFNIANGSITNVDINEALEDILTIRGIADSKFTLFESVLDDVERNYLRLFLEPYKYRVKCIIKKICTHHPEYSYLRIDVKSIYKTRGEEKIVLPYFKTGTMYQGMVEGRPYTFTELELESEEN